MKVRFFLGLCVLAWPLSASAEWSPSVDDLITALKPKADMRTRGLRPIGPVNEPMPAPAVPFRAASAGLSARPMTAPRQPAVPAEGLASTSMVIQFDKGSDSLTPAAIVELDKLGRALSASELSGYKFRIEGHTDAVGSRAMNDALSARRADRAVDYIATHYGVQRTRLTAVGMGFTHMAVPTAEGVSEPRNRRVQIVNLGE